MTQAYTCADHNKEHTEKRWLQEVVLMKTKCRQIEAFACKLPQQREDGELLAGAVPRLKVIGG